MRLSARWLSAYYLLGTIGFWILDAFLHAPVRVALGTAQQRALYYVALLGLGWLSRAKPRVAPVVGIVESAVNLVLIFIGLWLPILSISDSLAQDGAAGPPLSPFRVINAALAVGVLTFALRRNEAQLQSAGLRGKSR